MADDLATAHRKSTLTTMCMVTFLQETAEYFSLNGLEKHGRRLVLTTIWLLGLSSSVGYLWLLMDLRMRRLTKII